MGRSGSPPAATGGGVPEDAGSGPTARVVRGETRVAGVIGWPARHSLSPIIHNAAYAALGLDWVYVAFDVPPERGRAAVGAVRDLGLAGLNVTMPHKAAAAAAVDELSPVAADLGAVNCVHLDGDRLVGDSTDGDGFVDGLRREPGVDPAGLRCVVVGAGGAGRAVARALGRAGAADVAVLNRSPGPARRAADLAGGAGRVGEPADVARADLVVNATPLGMAPSDPLPLDVGMLRGGQVVADLIYHPTETPLLAAAGAAGAAAVNGLGMLVHQAARALRVWTGAVPPVDAMTAAIRAELDRRDGFDARGVEGAT